MAAIVEHLEDRTLLSGSTFPFIDGDYTIDGLTATIDQDGDFLTLTNEMSQVSSGDFLSETQIIANDWEGGLIGDLFDGWIAWANGTVWFDDDATPDSTDWTINGGVANTLRDGNDLVFTNEMGDVSQGYYLSGTEVYANDWEGGLIGDIVEDRIEWQNATTWTITAGVGLGAPQFDPDWYAFGVDEDAAVATVVGTLAATDPQGQSVSYNLSDPAGGSVPFAVDSAGTITVDAALDYDVQDFYSLEATATDTESNTSVAATLEIYVNESTIPQASDTSRTVLHDFWLEDSIAWDASDDDGDALTFILDSLPANGTLYDDFGSTLSAGQTFDGDFTYYPDYLFVGTDSFTWHANDGDYDSNIATLTFDVYNTQPQSWDAWYDTSLNGAISGDLHTTAYDEDATVTPDLLTFTLETLPSAGTLYDGMGSPLVLGQPFNGYFQWLPPQDWTGTTEFTWYASDSIEDGETVTMHLEVTPSYSSRPLVANDDIAITERGTPVNINVLGNDGSLDGMLMVTDLTQPANGSVWHDSVEIHYTPTDPAFTGTDTFYYTVADGVSDPIQAKVDVYVIHLDLDVDNDGYVGGSYDGVDNYLPGYVGDQPVLSTGSSYNEAQYLGQEMQLIVEGIGYDAGVTQVVFELTSYSTYDGYSENTSDPAIEGTDKDKDFAFAEDVNQSLVVLSPAELQATKSPASFWAKDYGAVGTVEVTVRIGVLSATFVTTAPTDKDNDKLPDWWEKQEVARWNSVFGTSHPVDITFFKNDASDPQEPADPDGTGASFYSVGANSQIYIKDIRPLGSAGIVRVQFVNAVASSGLTISTATSGNDTTITVELADDGTNVTSTANDVITALNSDATTKTIVSAQAVNGDGSGVVDTEPLIALGILPAHLWPGDSLTVKQEQRGFYFDGGHYGVAAHTQLSPVYKELLVEVDVMEKLTTIASLADIKTILNDVADGFSDKRDDKADGAGIRMFWVFSDKAAKPFKEFKNDADANEWANHPTKGHRDRTLKKEFVHLLFTHKQGGDTGLSDENGSFIFLTTMKSQHDTFFKTTDLKDMIAHTVAHELTHLLLDTESANGFDGDEHLHNPDPSDPTESAKDRKYLMYYRKSSANADNIIFSNATISQIDLTSKESVERLPPLP